MIRDILEENEKVKPNSNFLRELKLKLPDFFTIDKFDSEGNLIENGGFNFDKFHNAILEKNKDELQSGYQLDFIGKDYAKKQAGERPTTVVIPDNDHNQLSENRNSKNLFFTGDNLDVLKHLQSNYVDSIDIIYIDPPYNTGSDGFLYPDKFEYSDQMLQDMFGLSDKELDRLKSIQGKASHSAWLTFIYPRLWLSKRLLKETGVIFVSIDDNEQANLKLVMDEIFGEGSFVEEYIWESTFRPDNSSPVVRRNAEFVLLYAKNRFFLKELIGSTEQSEGLPSLTKNSMNTTTLSFEGNVVRTYLSNGEYKAGEKNSGYILENDVTVLNGYIVTPFKLTGKVIWGQEYLDQQLRDGTEIIIKSDGFVPYSKKQITTSAPNKLIPNDIVMDVLAGRAEVSQLFDKLPVFAYPKPTSLITYLIKMLGDKKDSVVLDFFAGSATTADAVMQINAKDNGNRQYIMVQLNEPTFETNNAGERVPLKSSEVAFNAGFMSIDEISRERIKLASKRLVTENEALQSGDFDKGFKHYRVVSPIQPVLDDLVSFDLESGLFLKTNGQLSQLTESGFDDMITPFSSKGLNVPGNATGAETILTTWIITDGYKLDTKVEKIEIEGFETYYIEQNRLYLIHLGWGTKNTKELLNRIGTNQLNIQTLVIYGYSFDLESMRELELGLKQLNTKVNLVKRY